MALFYTLILCFSAWLASYGLARFGGHLSRITHHAWRVDGHAALISTLAFLIVAAAPAPLILAATLLALLEYRNPHPLLAHISSPRPLVAALVPLLAAPFLSAPAYIALDAAILIASLLGVLTATRFRARLATVTPFLLIFIWLIAIAVLHGAFIPAIISLLVYGAFITYERTHAF